jgi:KipI family sensor histidine kinase inhibitor
MKVRFLSAGDRALVVEFGDRIERELSDDVLRLDAGLRSSGLPGVVETVPTFRSLMVHYDPMVTARADLERVITSLLDCQSGPRAAATLWRVPVCYDVAFAPDLAEVAHLTGATPSEVVALHSAARYHVYMLGFLPGFPYMGDLPHDLALPRRADPRLRVPAGSVSIATTLTAIYPFESPGGWHLIGMTPIRLFDPTRPGPALLAPGDKVQFEPIDPASFASIRRAVDSGKYEVANEPIAGSVMSLPPPGDARDGPSPLNPGVTRQSTSQIPGDGMDARVKPGHDDKGQ